MLLYKLRDGSGRYDGLSLIHKGTVETQDLNLSHVMPLVCVASQKQTSKLMLDGSLIDAILPFIYSGNNGGRMVNAVMYITLGESGLVLDQWEREVPDNSSLLRNWSKRIEPHLDEAGQIPEGSVVLIPVCLRREVHYVLLIMNPVQRTIFVMDSLCKGALQSPSIVETATVFGNWFDNKGQVLKQYVAANPWKVQPDDLPQQLDGYSCGYIVTLKVMELISDDDFIYENFGSLQQKRYKKDLVYFVYRKPAEGARLILDEIFRKCDVFLTFQKPC